jgi:hypothetical protein
MLRSRGLQSRDRKEAVGHPWAQGDKTVAQVLDSGRDHSEACPLQTLPVFETAGSVAWSARRSILTREMRL